MSQTGVHATSQYLDNSSFDGDFGVYAHENLVYNPGTNTMDRKVEVAPAYVKFDADDSAPTYIGINASATAADGDATWTIYKFTYSGANVTAIQRKSGSWTGRVALFA